MTPLFPQIKQRLEAATPGKWWLDAEDIYSNHGGLWALICEVNCSGKDAALIANAPTDIAKLLAALELAVQALEQISKSEFGLYVDKVYTSWADAIARQALARISEESEA